MKTEIKNWKEGQIMAKVVLKEAVQKTMEKTEPVVRKAKDAAKTAVKKAEPVLEAAKNAGKQLAEGYVPEIYVQYLNRQFDCAELLERCKEDFRAKHKNARIRSCKLYIKPEDDMVYYVINDREDKVEL